MVLGLKSRFIAPAMRAQMDLLVNARMSRDEIIAALQKRIADGRLQRE